MPAKFQGAKNLVLHMLQHNGQIIKGGGVIMTRRETDILDYYQIKQNTEDTECYYFFDNCEIYIRKTFMG